MPHDAADGSRSSHGWDGTPRIGCDVSERSRNTTEQVEDYESDMPHRVLDVVPEDPQEPHVSDQVHPTAVHEHRGNDRHPAQPTDLADGFRRQFQYLPRLNVAGNVGRDRAKGTQRLKAFIQKALNDTSSCKRLVSCALPRF